MTHFQTTHNDHLTALKAKRATATGNEFVIVTMMLENGLRAFMV